MAGHAAFAKISRAEAEQIEGMGALRPDIEALLSGLRRSYPTLEGLVMYVVEEGRVVGFAELIIVANEVNWHGPHVAPPSAGVPTWVEP